MNKEVILGTSSFVKKSLFSVMSELEPKNVVNQATQNTEGLSKLGWWLINNSKRILYFMATL